MDEKAREERERLEDREAYQTADALEAASTSAVPFPSAPAPIVPTPPPVVLSARSHPAIAGLRISMPKIATPGLRAAVSRPQAPLLTPKSIAAATAAAKLAPAPPPALLVVSNSAPPIAAPAPTLPAAGPEPPLLPSHLCSSYFVEPLSWMSTTLDSGILAGKLVCPNTRCGAKIGSYDWAGSRESLFRSPRGEADSRNDAECSCGAWVCPGFAIGVAKVDEIA